MAESCLKVKSVGNWRVVINELKDSHMAKVGDCYKNREIYFCNNSSIPKTREQPHQNISPPIYSIKINTDRNNAARNNSRYQYASFLLLRTFFVSSSSFPKTAS